MNRWSVINKLTRLNNVKKTIILNSLFMKINLFVYFTMLVLLASNCRDKPDVIPPNPCIDKIAFKADFTIEEKVSDTSYITDKALAPGIVFFKAKGIYDSVRWYIGGTQNTSTARNYALYFNQGEADIPVTFIGYKKPNLVCFPNDKAADTVRKTFSVFNRSQTAAIVGRFLGYNTNNPTDTFSVYVNADNSKGFWDYFVKNLPKNCPGYIQVSDSHPRNIGLNASVGFAAFKLSDAASTICASITGFGF